MRGVEKREKYDKARKKRMRKQVDAEKEREKGCDNEDSSSVTHIR